MVRRRRYSESFVATKLIGFFLHMCYFSYRDNDLIKELPYYAVIVWVNIFFYFFPLIDVSSWIFFVINIVSSRRLSFYPLFTTWTLRQTLIIFVTLLNWGLIFLIFIIYMIFIILGYDIFESNPIFNLILLSNCILLSFLPRSQLVYTRVKIQNWKLASDWLEEDDWLLIGYSK